MQVFTNNDKSYLNWMGSNPNTFVVNTERRKNTKYFVLHKSGCPHIATTNGLNHGGYTEREYIKICSGDVVEIENWLENEKPYFRGITIECKTCSSTSSNGSGIGPVKSVVQSIGNGLEAKRANPISVNFENIAIGGSYDRKVLASMWGYQSFQAISKGVITPANTKLIVLFVTKVKQTSQTQYKDYISDGYLYWEGEEKGPNNKRIIASSQSGDIIHLFFREKHHTEFTYKGIIELESYVEHGDSQLEAVFKIIGDATEEETEFESPRFIVPSPDAVTSRQSLISSRVGQGVYRQGLVKLWQTCSITGVDLLEVLVASHIKPWKDSDNRERLDPYNGLLLTPNLDALFDKGLISFQNDGSIIISKFLSRHTCTSFNIEPQTKLRNLFDQNLPYLEFHRKWIFKG